MLENEGPVALAGADRAGTGQQQFRPYTPPHRQRQVAGSQCRISRDAPVAWSSQQLDAIERIETWLGKGDRPFFYLAGFAGTGKTTTQRRIADVAGDNVLFAAFTGKAASVMARKGCVGATTLDRLIYHHPFQWRCAQDCRVPPCADLCRHAWQEFGGRQLNLRSAVAGADLVIVDEVSMVGEEMARDLLSFETPILVIGDPGQLPPINGSGYFTEREPDAFLTEIHRQAAGNPIIDLATMAREERALPLGPHGDSTVMRINDFKDNPTDFDIVICGRNDTRRQINSHTRRLLGFTDPLPMVGEKLLILRNRPRQGLMNGEVVTVTGVGDEAKGFLPLGVVTDDGRAVKINAPADLLLADDSKPEGVPGDPVTWGYCLTGHKSQGSQWDRVLLVDEARCFREQQFRWRYTSITRAAERITVLNT